MVRRPVFKTLPPAADVGPRSRVAPRLRAVLPLALLSLVACEKQPSEIKVKGPRDAVESVKMNPQFAPFEKKGETLKLRASAFDDKGVFMGVARVRWDSSDRSVATVDQSGLVTILSSGDVVIKAIGEGYEKPLEGAIPLRAIIIDKVKIVGSEDKKLRLGETRPYRAEVLDDRGRPIDGAKVRWRSSGYAATVTDTGEVEGRAIGGGQIVVEAGNATDRLDIEVLDWTKGGRGR